MELPLPRKISRTTTQVSIPREWVGLLIGGEWDDDEKFRAVFGEPPKVVLELEGDPPVSIRVWPLSRWPQRLA